MSENTGAGENLPPIDTSRFDQQVEPLTVPAEELVSGNIGNKDRFNQVMAVMPMDSNLRRHLTTNNPKAINAYAGHCAQELSKLEAQPTIEDTFAIHALTISQVAMQRFMILDETDVPIGVEKSVENAGTYFLTQFAEHLAWQVPMETLERGPSPRLFNRAIRPQVEQIAENYDAATDWYTAKFKMLALDLARRLHLEPLLREEPEQEVVGLKRLRRGNDELMSALRALPEHSITSAAFKEEGGKAWSVHDLFDVKAQIAMAESSGGGSIDYNQWVTAKMVAVEHDDDQRIYHPGVETDADADEALRNVENARAEGFYRMCFMDASGELYIDERSTISYGRLYQKLGKFANYELLRRELIGAYFDLIAPNEVRDRVSEGDIRDPSAFVEAGKIQGSKLVGAFHNPRIRALRAYKPPKEDV